MRRGGGGRRRIGGDRGEFFVRFVGIGEGLGV